MIGKRRKRKAETRKRNAENGIGVSFFVSQKTLRRSLRLRSSVSLCYNVIRIRYRAPFRTAGGSVRSIP
jgi:hypothetical protein